MQQTLGFCEPLLWQQRVLKSRGLPQVYILLSLPEMVGGCGYSHCRGKAEMGNKAGEGDKAHRASKPGETPSFCLDMVYLIATHTPLAKVKAGEVYPTYQTVQ